MALPFMPKIGVISILYAPAQAIAYEAVAWFTALRTAALERPSFTSSSI
jgi:hypothetical protein